MAPDTSFAALARCLLALSFATTTTQTENTTVVSLAGKVTTNPIPDLTTPGAMVTSPTTIINGSTVSATDIAKSTEGTTPLTNTSIAMATTPERTSPAHTAQSTIIWTSTTNVTSLTATVPSTESPTSTVPTSQATQTTVDNTSTPETTFTPTEIVSSTKTSESMHNATQGLELNNTERNMTILFSVLLGVFVVGLMVYMLSRFKQRIQYSHQPLYNTEDTDRFVEDDDTLVISGGLYDGHLIYDNQPTATTEPSQFCLEFLNEEERIPTS